MEAVVPPAGAELETKSKNESPTLQSILKHQRTYRSGSLDRETTFSWIHCAVFIFSYLLLLTDMFRTRISISSVNFTPLEPNIFSSFGPYGYPVVHILNNATNSRTKKVWSYKFDTTSIGIRTLAQYFQLSAWPPCMVYEEKCPRKRMGYPTVFGMLDSVVDPVAQLGKKHKHDRPGITFRTENLYADRLNDFVFPFFFNRKVLRTVQALYYDMETVASEQFQFCTSMSNQPYTCNDAWINFERTCTEQNAPCVPSRVIWQDIVTNTRALAKRNPGMQMDMLLIEAYGDSGIETPSYQGRQSYDVLLVTRIRNCTSRIASTPSQCTTVAVDDYRYEGESMSTNIVDWHIIIAVTRILGQGYAYLRMASFFYCCYKARSAEPEFTQASRLFQLRGTLRTMFTAPSQVVTYGSMITVFAYTFAHLIDSAMVYEEVYDQFTAQDGTFKFDLRHFIRVATISMRSLWLLATVFHIFQFLRTRGQCNPTTKGVPGVPEFTLSATAFLTISSQFRSLSFRTTDIVSISEVVPSARGRMIRAARYDNTRTLAYMFCLGDTLDAKYLTVCFLAVTVLSIVVYVLVRLVSKLKIIPSHDLTIWPHTIVSYAAGTLWPVNALVVSWHGFVVTPVGYKRYLPVNPSTSLFKKKKSSIYITDESNTGKITTASFIVNRSEESRIVQNSIAYLYGRSPGVNATLYLMNLTVMSDPIVLSRLYWYGGLEIGIYRSSRHDDQLFLLPMAIARSEQNFKADVSQMELLGVVNSMELPWGDLFQCG